MSPVPASVPLSARLREATSEAHREAEGTPWARALAAGRTGPTAYAGYLAALLPVYDALERAVTDHLDDPCVAAVHHPGLARRSALAADVRHWGDAVVPAAAEAASHAYAARITEAAAADPALLVAHHYVRYLGDLSGGQVVAAALVRQDPRHGAGTSLYVFDEVADATQRGGRSTVPFLRRYRDRLDALPLDDRRAAGVVAEARESFGASTRLFRALEPMLPTGAVPHTD